MPRAELLSRLRTPAAGGSSGGGEGGRHAIAGAVGLSRINQIRKDRAGPWTFLSPWTLDPQARNWPFPVGPKGSAGHLEGLQPPRPGPGPGTAALLPQAPLQGAAKGSRRDLYAIMSLRAQSFPWAPPHSEQNPSSFPGPKRPSVTLSSPLLRTQALAVWWPSSVWDEAGRAH